jgi:hypothetical protein
VKKKRLARTADLPFVDWKILDPFNARLKTALVQFVLAAA